MLLLTFCMILFGWPAMILAQIDQPISDTLSTSASGLSSIPTPTIYTRYMTTQPATPVTSITDAPRSGIGATAVAGLMALVFFVIFGFIGLVLFLRRKRRIAKGLHPRFLSAEEYERRREPMPRVYFPGVAVNRESGGTNGLPEYKAQESPPVYKENS